MTDGKDFYFTIHGWMIHELGLRGVNLYVFSLIYSVTKKGAFTWSVAKISHSLQCSPTSVKSALAYLSERRLIFIEKKPGKACVIQASHVREYKPQLSTYIENESGVYMYNKDYYDGDVIDDGYKDNERPFGSLLTLRFSGKNIIWTGKWTKTNGY